MPKGYTHLAYEQRCQIYILLKRNFSKNKIVETIGGIKQKLVEQLRATKVREDIDINRLMLRRNIVEKN